MRERRIEFLGKNRQKDLLGLEAARGFLGKSPAKRPAISRVGEKIMKMTAGDMALSLNLEIGFLRRDGIDEREVTALEQHLTRLVAIVDGFQRQVEAARISGKYTVSGLREYIETLGSTARTSIASLAANVDYATRIGKAQEKLASVPLRRPKLEEKTTTSGEKILLADPLPAADLVRDEQRQQEIRGLMRELDVVLRWEKYVTAIEDDDVDTISAIEQAPKSFPILKQKQLAEGLRMRQRLAAPVVAKQLDDLERLDAVWSGALKMEESCLESEGVPPAVDAIAAAAKAA